MNVHNSQKVEKKLASANIVNYYSADKGKWKVDPCWHLSQHSSTLKHPECKESTTESQESTGRKRRPWGVTSRVCEASYDLMNVLWNETGDSCTALGYNKNHLPVTSLWWAPWPGSHISTQEQTQPPHSPALLASRDRQCDFLHVN